MDSLQELTNFQRTQTKFPIFPKTGKVLACKEDKNGYEFDRGLAQEFITAALTAVLMTIWVFRLCYVVLTGK